MMAKQWDGQGAQHTSIMSDVEKLRILRNTYSMVMQEHMFCLDDLSGL